MIGGNMIDWISDPFGEDFDDLKNKVKTEEEINRFATKDDMSELKLLKLEVVDNHEARPVHEGVWSQGRTIPDYIGKWIQDQEYILVWSDEMQLECAASLIKVLHNGLLDTSTIDKLTSNTLELLLYTDQRHVKSWLKVFQASVNSMSQECLEGEVIPQIAKMQHFKQPWLSRKTAAKMLRHCFTEMHQRALQFQELPTLVQALAQDADWNMRKKMSKYLEPICTALPPHLGEKHAISELMELIKDMEIQVQLEALLSIFKHLKLISVDQIEEEIFPVLRELMSSQEENILLGLASSLGQMLHQIFLIARKLLPKAKELFKNFYQEKMLHGDCKMQEMAAHHLPCMMYVFCCSNPDISKVKVASDNTPALEESKEEEEQPEQSHQGLIMDITQFMLDVALIQDPNETQITMKRSMAACIHEIIGYFPEQTRMEGVDTVLKSLMESENNEVQEAVSLNLHKTLINYFDNIVLDNEDRNAVSPYRRELLYEHFLHSLRILESNLKKAGWRAHLNLIANFPKIQMLFRVTAFGDAFYTHLLDYMRHGFRDTKLVAVETFARLLHNDFRSGVRSKYIKKMVDEFAHSNSCYSRMTFIEFCSVAAQAYSRAFFNDYGLYDSFLETAHDKITDVKLKFLQAAPTVRKVLSFDDNKNNVRLLDCISLLTNSEIKCISDAAMDCELQLTHTKYRDPTIVAKMDEENRSKMSHERNLDLLEKEAEMEEEIKRSNESSSTSLFGGIGVSSSFSHPSSQPAPFTMIGSDKSSDKGSFIGLTSGMKKGSKIPPGSKKVSRTQVKGKEKWPLSVSPIGDSKASSKQGDKTFSTFVSDTSNRRNSSYSKKYVAPDSSRPQVGPSKFQKRHTIVLPSSQSNLLLGNGSKGSTSLTQKSRPGSPSLASGSGSTGSFQKSKTGLSSSLPRPSHFTKPTIPKKKYSALD